MTRLLAITVLVSGCLSPIVGAECRPGLVPCDGRCVDLAAAPEGCGVPSEPAADGGTPWPDAARIESDAGTPPLWRPDIRGPLGVLPPPSGPQCDLGELACDGRCVRADRDSAHCGACGNACAAEETCVAGACADVCPATHATCGGACVDTQNDPDHCGGCGLRCDTGVCIDGACESAFAGHLVVIGHDYGTRREGMSRIVGNAVLLPTRRSVRVLAYAGTASVESRAGVIAAVEASALASGRTWERESVEPERVSYRLAFADVFLIHAQSGVAMDGVGRAWAAALASFLERGGTIVALVGASAGTLDILEAAGLLEARTDQPVEITGARVTLVRSWDAVAIGVPLTYRAERTTVRLPLELGAAVVSDGIGPVVVHRAIAPPD